MTADNLVNISGGNVQGFIQENHGTVTQYFISQVSELISGQASGAEQVLTQGEYRQRKVLLSKVKEYWIEGVLEKSLHTKAMIELGLEKRSDAVERPFSGFEELPEESRQILPTGTGATEVFNQIGEGRTLLILGEPGAGKTITLLKLAQNLIARAEGELSRLIPVVFNLSSWGSKRQTLADWLIEELYNKYKVSKTLGKNWIEEQQLLLLLDGLDEVKADRREACVEAINQFMQKHGQTEIVVCSRVADYENLTNRLQLRGAIYIRALTPEQINQYLDAAGEQLGAVKTLLQEDTVLQELAKSPLTLSVMTLAYQGKKVEELPQTGSAKVRREHLFNVYIARMFSQEKIGKPGEYKSPYQNQQTRVWLTWLAQQMSQASQTIFFIEKIQPIWLLTGGQKKFYQLGTCLMGLLMGLLIGLLIGSFVGQPGEGLVIGGLNVLLPLAWRIDDIKTVETLKWSWQEATKFSINGLFSGLPLAIAVGISLENLSLVIPYWLITVAILGFLGGLRGPEIAIKTSPNQGIWNSVRNSLALGVVGAVLGLLIVVFNANWLGLGLIFGLIFGLVVGGGKACFQHFTLRLILWIKGFIPWNYARFLDYAAERVFLQKVGGGYIFVHRILLEHFAQME
jgi:Fe-S cluster biosynthesis and repair protein YggX